MGDNLALEIFDSHFIRLALANLMLAFILKEIHAVEKLIPIFESRPF